MQTLFGSSLAAFCYLLFVLLYMPCVATIGVIYKEQGPFWAAFSVVWSLVIGYAAAVLVYQIGTFAASPVESLGWCAFVLALVAATFAALVRFGRRRSERLIPLVSLD